MFYFSAPWNNGKTKSFQTFLGGEGGIEMKHWLEKGWYYTFRNQPHKIVKHTQKISR